MIRVMIADDDINYRCLLKIMCRTFLDVVAEVGSAEQALAGLAVAKPSLSSWMFICPE